MILPVRKTQHPQAKVGHQGWLKTLSIVTALFFSLSATVKAKQDPITYDIPNVTAEITFDGELDESVWRQAKKIDMDIVNYPYDNTKSPVKTTAYLFEDGENLYIGFIAEDPHPEKIQGFYRDRDDAFSDDIVGIKLDTFNDDRLAYKFFVNPLGVQNDGITNEMTGDENNLWDGIWPAYGKITDKGYQVEMAIPYRELNFDENIDIKTWGFELIRIYPRDTILRISNMPIDKNDYCWVCQMDDLRGFQDAKLGKNLLVTPSLVYSYEEERDLYAPDDVGQEWQDSDDTDVGVNVRWGITPDILLNATINPDFSTVEADNGQLSVNKTSALFFAEKRPFFLDNSEYFSTPFNLVYTRNIINPDWGAKLTGRSGNHSFAGFVTNDDSTSLIMPGNLFSTVANIDEESFSGAFRYRYDVNDDLSFGAITTIRDSDNYENLVAGIDTKYKITQSDTIIAQLLHSQTTYPQQLLDSYCPGGNCYLASLVGIDDDEFDDIAYQIEYEHSTEDWRFHNKYEDIGKEFRSDLGFQVHSDYNKFSSTLNRFYYSDQHWWSTLTFGAQYSISHNDDDELISKTQSVSASAEGPWQSFFDLVLTHEDRVGLRYDSNDASIDDNTTRFSLSYADFIAEAQPLPNVFVGLSGRVGEGIDYLNDREGDIYELAPFISWNVTAHLETELTLVYAELEADGDFVYRENIADLRMTYAFDINNLLRLSMVYTSAEYNQNNNPQLFGIDGDEDNLATELIYSYKLNPQTVFFLGYSDNSIDNREVGSLKQNQRNVFMKMSYAWM
ncbi:hypothetical protein E2K93_14965 [Thalassotalea sp. HSM 43]|uniref:carbohydrate binding family 9 domain-containing protein n=1 Tax=Thalassotalea sp. HSM 43 TaxID=2552945 RepID=UPI00107FDF04|nr:carbohydrate binding family 9 domain-containing protein [Thalassotalea sp. HSM 43]QBY05590.1 hypothetical protein E2K93_14965 [Thalassotalea sp. HSM 43]